MVHEFRRAIRCSSTELNGQYSIQLIRQKFINNGYPARMVNNAERRAQQPPRRQENRNPIFVKVPFVDERSATELRKSARKTGLPINLSFSNARPLSLQLRKPPKVPCPATCVCNGRGQCLRKNCVYSVSCRLCPENDDYIGETHRTLHKRTTEHFTKDDSNVFRHFVDRHPGDPVRGNVDVRVLNSVCENTMHRIAMEQTCIDKKQPRINVQLN